MSEQKRTFFSTTLRPGESPFQLAAEFAGIGIFGLVFLGIGLIPLADGRALGNAALSYVVGAVLCVLGLGLVGFGCRGVWSAMRTWRASRRSRKCSSTRDDSRP